MKRPHEFAMGVQAAIFRDTKNPYRKHSERWSLWNAGWSAMVYPPSEQPSRPPRATVTRRNGEYLKCEICEKEFYATRYRVKNGRRYCSDPCSRFARRGRKWGAKTK